MIFYYEYIIEQKMKDMDCYLDYTLQHTKKHTPGFFQKQCDVAAYETRDMLNSVLPPPKSKVELISQYLVDHFGYERVTARTTVDTYCIEED